MFAEHSVDDGDLCGRVVGEGFVLALVYYTGTPMNAVLIALPPLIFVLTESAAPNASGGVGRWVYVQVRQRLARPWPIIIFFCLLVGVLASGLFHLRTSVNLLQMFRPGSSIRTENAWFEEAVGPTSSADLLLKFAPLGEKDDPLERLEVVKQAHIVAVKMDSIGGALYAMTFMKSAPTGRTISASSRRAAIAKSLRNPESAIHKTKMISRNDNSEIWRISLKLWKKEDTDYNEELDLIRENIRTELADSNVPVEIALTGPIVIVDAAQTVLLKDLFRSFLTAFAIVAVVMVFVLRSVIGGLIAMIPDLFPTLALFGWMGLNRTALDIGSVMTASVALGIAVDDTIHLLSRFGSRRQRGFGQIRAAHGALSQCGWAMFQTTMVCGLSLMAYYFSDLSPPVSSPS